MSTRRTASEVLNDEFLEVRSRLLQLAAGLDRIDRAAGSVSGDPRLAAIARAVDVLQGGGPNRAEQIQLIFSRDYHPDWRSDFKLTNGHP